MAVTVSVLLIFVGMLGAFVSTPRPLTQRDLCCVAVYIGLMGLALYLDLKK